MVGTPLSGIADREQTLIGLIRPITREEGNLRLPKYLVCRISMFRIVSSTGFLLFTRFAVDMLANRSDFRYGPPRGYRWSDMIYGRFP
jgi:hypothetical protein